MRRGERGFTLIELLVALFVFSLVSAAAVYALRLGVEARDQLEKADGRMADLEIARIVIKEDLAQLVARPVRDEFGQPQGPAFQGGMESRRRNAVAGETLLMAFVRGGWANPGADAPRSTLQYVEYLEKDGALVRRIRPFLDDARGQPHFDRVLISDVSELRVGFLNGFVRGELDWAPGWPMPGAGDAPPRAVSLEFMTERFGALEQFFWIGDLPGVREASS